MHSDVLIVGGGPAGATLGCLLRDAGIACRIVDRAVFPRDKLCGGLLSDKTLRLFTRLLPDVDLSRTEGVRLRRFELFHRYRPVSAFETERDFMLVERMKLDELIVRAFQNRDGVLSEGVNVADIDGQSGAVVLSDGQKIVGRVLVGADGVHSAVRRQVDARYAPGGFSCETFVPKARTDLPGDRIGIHFGVIPKGYGWVFPRSDTFAIGVVAPREGRVDPGAALLDFCKELGVREELSVRGSHIPFGRVVSSPVRGQTLLIGDAAGLVDSLTGEGLFHALTSAEIAARCIVEHLRTGASLEAYAREIRAVHERIAHTRRVQAVFYNPLVPKILFRGTKTYTRSVKYVFDNGLSTGAMSYGEAAWGYLKGKVFGN